MRLGKDSGMEMVVVVHPFHLDSSPASPVVAGDYQLGRMRSVRMVAVWKR